VNASTPATAADVPSKADAPAAGNAVESAATVPPDPRGGLTCPSFLGLLVTQFLGAMNDNIFRWLVVPIGTHLLAPRFGGEEQAANIALSLGTACLVGPFVVLAAPAGYLADRFSKRTVIVWCKVAEVVLMLMGSAAIWAGEPISLFVSVFLMGAQSALFGPSKLGSIPEIVRPDKISAANGLIGLTTVVAIIGGTVIGGFLYSLTWSAETGLVNLWYAAGTVVGVAAVGWLASLFIRPLPVANPTLRFPTNPIAATWGDLRTVGQSKALLRVALGVALFWSIASLAQVNVATYVKFALDLGQSQVGPLLAVLSLGVGIGSVLAGMWSGGRVELGIVPLGAAGIALSSMLLFTSTGSYVWTASWLFALGMAGGLFDVPLAAYLQHRSPADKRGAVLAASNFLTFSGALGASALFFVLREVFHLSAPAIFLLAGIATIPVFLYAVFLLPGATIRFTIWLATRTIYRLRVYGGQNLPPTGGALLVANHVTWLDGVFMILASSRPVRLVAHTNNLQGRGIRWLADLFGVIPITPGRKSVVESLETARQAIEAGELVCIFPEGGLTRTGQMQEFKPGLLRIVQGTGAPIVPVYLDELWGSIFSFHGGKFFWKRPRSWPYPVSIHFGPPVTGDPDIHRVRQAVERLGVTAVERRKERKLTLPRQFLRMCRRNFFRKKIADSTGAELTGAGLLLKTLVFRRLLVRKLLARDEQFVGLLLPPSVAAVVANAAVPLAGRVGVNLNYTVSSDVMNSCIAQCGIRHVLTSRKFMEKIKIDVTGAELVYLEDLKDVVGLSDKLVAAAMTYLKPVFALERLLGLHRTQPDDLLTIIFTSGSTGEPKGVMLSHYNVASNVEAMNQVVQLSKADVAIGVLPFFHSFGYTGLLWTMLTLDPMGVYHFSPLDAQQVGKLARKYGATMLMITPTFLRSYLRRCDVEDFRKLDVVFAGAEKLPKDLVDAFEAKFRVRPCEAYGTTELSPLVSVNVPASRSRGSESSASKEGTVGRPIPGVAAKIVHPETGEELGANEPGMLLITGPNVMQGYYKRPDLTEQVIRDGWYVTGDMALIDSDGFIQITGRLSRFSKIGGEMVPHLKIEATLQNMLSPDGEELKAVVTAVPDAKKGERLVVLHTQLDRTPAELCKGLAEAGLPNLWIPSPDSFHEVPEIPVLGTGKLDLKRLKDLAVEVFC
jgi:acyl-[acyl-carrier-protein]-phospholipid O-acyltransferase / long-chain-fatty-acid--[acyl-carrier-protein] ligase